MVESFSLFCDDLGGIVHHFHCSENLLVAFKYIDLIRLLCWIEFKYDWCGISVVLEYDICAMFYRSRDSIFVLGGVGGL